MMLTTLLIFLNDKDIAHSCVLASDTENKIHEGFLKDFSVHKDTKVDVVIPGQHVLLTPVELPKLSKSRLKDAVPFAIEDYLLEDIQYLHFAIEIDTHKKIHVAIIKKELLSAWLKILSDLNIFPQRMIPSMLAIPYQSAITINESLCLVRKENYQGFVSDLNNLKLLSLNSAMDYNASAISDTHQLVKNMHQWLQTYPTINLLQGEYQPKILKPIFKKSWTLAIVAAGIWLILIFSHSITTYFILRHSAESLEIAIEKIYKTHFPEATQVVAPRERLNAKLKNYKNISDKNLILSLLSDIETTLNHSEPITIQTMDFHDNTLTLTLSTRDFKTIDLFKESLSNHGFNVKQKNANINDNLVFANLLIEKKL